jgi:hypothetical protein
MGVPATKAGVFVHDEGFRPVLKWLIMLRAYVSSGITKGTLLSEVLTSEPYREILLSLKKLDKHASLFYWTIYDRE